MSTNSSQTTTSQMEQDLETARALDRALNPRRRRRGVPRYSESGFATRREVNEAINDGQGTSPGAYTTNHGTRRIY